MTQVLGKMVSRDGSSKERYLETIRRHVVASWPRRCPVIRSKTAPLGTARSPGIPWPSPDQRV